jgi:uncharacterized DUF497 family protein
LTFKSIAGRLNRVVNTTIALRLPMWSRPDYIDWDEINTHHIEASDLTPEEVETVLDNPDGDAEPDRGSPPGAEFWIVFGFTDTGKHIAVVFEIQCDDPFHVRPITAYEAPEYGDAD